MKTWVLLLRGINVGGRNVLPMKELAVGLTSLKMLNVRTYIQSGNVVFQFKGKLPKTLNKRIADSIEERDGFRPGTFILSSEELEETIAANPFPEATGDPKSLHCFFLSEPVEKMPREQLNELASATEKWRLINQTFYLHAPDGVGRSKLAAGVEKTLGVPTTARNWKTVLKLSDMVRAT